MASRYKIGLTVETLASLDELDVPLPDPQAVFHLYQTKKRLGNRKLKGRGPQTVIWQFPLLEIEEQSAADNYLTDEPIYIQSPDKDEVDTIYEVDVNILNPDDSGDHKPSFPGYRAGLVFEFTILSEVEGS